MLDQLSFNSIVKHNNRSNPPDSEELNALDL